MRADPPAEAVTAAAKYLERVNHAWIPATDSQRESYRACAKGMLAAVQAATAERFVLVWRDERGEEICPSTPLKAGDMRIGIPLDAFCADLLPDAADG